MSSKGLIVICNYERFPISKRTAFPSQARPFLLKRLIRNTLLLFFPEYKCISIELNTAAAETFLAFFFSVVGLIVFKKYSWQPRLMSGSYQFKANLGIIACQGEVFEVLSCLKLNSLITVLLFSHPIAL